MPGVRSRFRVRCGRSEEAGASVYVVAVEAGTWERSRRTRDRKHDPLDLPRFPCLGNRPVSSYQPMGFARTSIVTDKHARTRLQEERRRSHTARTLLHLHSRKSLAALVRQSERSTQPGCRISSSREHEFPMSYTLF